MSDTRFIHYPLNPPMSAKRGVEIELLDAPMRSQLVPLSYLWRACFARDDDGMTLTSTYEGFSGDGVHGKDSLHYKARAIDLRIRDVEHPRVGVFCKMARNLLGEDYDVVLEGDHIHIEYDPKTELPGTVPLSQPPPTPKVVGVPEEVVAATKAEVDSHFPALSKEEEEEALDTEIELKTRHLDLDQLQQKKYPERLLAEWQARGGFWKIVALIVDLIRKVL